MLKYFFSVDPGINGTGVAIWDLDHKYKKVPPINAFTIKATKRTTWENRSNTMTKSFYSVLDRYKPEQIYMEYPAYFHSAGGKMVAERGDLVKLAALAGMLCGASTVSDFPVAWTWVNVVDWKGQLPKLVCVQRIDKILGQTFDSEHSYDAVGIGLWVKDLF